MVRFDVCDQIVVKPLHERMNSQFAELEAILFKTRALEKVVRNSNDGHLYGK